MDISEKYRLTQIVGTWRDRIKKSGKTEEQVADETGLSRGTVSNYLNGNTSPNIEKFEIMENYLRGLGV